MNWGDIRTVLRRQVKDTAGVQWGDSEMTAIMNVAYAFVQKEITKVDPEAHIFWDYMDSSVNVSWYPMPSTFGIESVSLMRTTGTAFKKLKYKDWDLIKDLEDSGSDPFWTIRGQFIGIFPPPSEAVTNGIQVIHNPIMSVGDDADFPRVKIPLHYAIILWSKLILLGDTFEAAPEVRTRLSEIFNDLPLWYNKNVGKVEKLQPGY